MVDRIDLVDPGPSSSQPTSPVTSVTATRGDRASPGLVIDDEVRGSWSSMVSRTMMGGTPTGSALGAGVGGIGVA